jgi:calcineurin-like phosphoesterase family protein
MSVRKYRRFNNPATTRKTIMKTLKNLLVVAAVVAVGAAFSANAGEPLYSPKAKELAYSLRKVPSVASGVNLATNRPIGNAKAWDLVQSLRKVPSNGASVNLAHAPRPTMSPKDPRYETAWRANAERGFQIAPVK